MGPLTYPAPVNLNFRIIMLRQAKDKEWLVPKENISKSALGVKGEDWEGWLTHLKHQDLPGLRQKGKHYTKC